VRILQLKTSAARGGAESLLLDLTAGLVERGHVVETVLGEQGWLQDRMQSKGLSVSVIPLVSVLGLFRIPQLAGLIKSTCADIVLAHGARVNLFGVLASVTLGVPVVSVEHSMDDWRTNSRFLSLVDRIVARRNIGRIAVSRAVGGMLNELDIISGDKVVVIPNGVRFPSRSRVVNRRAIRSRFGIDDGAFVVVTAARLTKPKGHKFLLEALPELIKRIPRFHCLLLGDGNMRAELEGRCNALELEDKVTFAGAVDDVLDILPACDLFALPSLWEGLPVALIEAMGMGLPVVATAVAGTPEVVVSGESGVLVAPGDTEALAEAITTLYENENIRRRVADVGRIRAREMFDMEFVVGRYESVLQSWLSS